RSFQCSRRADVLKLWFVMQRFGSRGLGALYDHLCNTAKLLYDAIENRDDFENLHEPESNILCFRFLGKDGKRRQKTSVGSDEVRRVDELNRAVRPLYNKEGSGWITATILEGRPVLRVTMMNPRTSASHVKHCSTGSSPRQQSWNQPDRASLPDSGRSASGDSPNSTACRSRPSQAMTAAEENTMAATIAI